VPARTRTASWPAESGFGPLQIHVPQSGQTHLLTVRPLSAVRRNSRGCRGVEEGYEYICDRYTLENQKGPFCVLTSQFKRKEAVAWRIRVLESIGDVADDKVLKSVVVELESARSR
jgi:hypothetical protein